LGGITMSSAYDLIQATDDNERVERTMQAFFSGRTSLLRPLRIPCDELEPLAVPALVSEMEAARAAMALSSAPPGATYRRFEHYVVRRDQAFCAEHLLRAGMPGVNAERYSLAEPTLAGAESTQAWALEEQQALRPALDAFDAAVSRRLAAGVVLQAHADPGRDVRALAHAVTILAEAIPLAFDAHRAFMAVQALSAATPALGPSPHLSERVSALTATIDDCHSTAHKMLRTAPSLSSYDAGCAAAWADAIGAEAAPAAVEFFRRVLDLYSMLLRRVVIVATQAEQSHERVEAAGA
jgi:hypothetical protein